LVYFSLFHLESVQFYPLEHERIHDIHVHPKQKTPQFDFEKTNESFTWSKKAICLDETTACCTTRFVNGEKTLGQTQPLVVIWSDISWSLENKMN
jgi:hypothetical protein